MKNFVVFDIHGNVRALRQVLRRSGFNYEKDKLVTIGDICDGWPFVYECVEELLKIKNRVDIRGNHDDWFYTWLETGVHPLDWSQGGQGTLYSYSKNLPEGKVSLQSIPDSHKEFFRSQRFYYIDENKNLFVHGGFDRHKPIEGQDPDLLMWDRTFWNQAMSSKDGKFKVADDVKTIYIGHTYTGFWKKEGKPIKIPIVAGSGRVINGDTGAGANDGHLTLICTDNGEYWQSETDLYRDESNEGISRFPQ